MADLIRAKGFDFATIFNFCQLKSSSGVEEMRKKSSLTLLDQHMDGDARIMK